jgi:hypothetical protein
MLTRRAHAALLCALTAALPAAAQRPGCVDTPHPDGRPGDLLASRYHLLQLHGDASARSTNFYADGYDGLVSGAELRLVLPRLSELGTGPVVLPDPFLAASAQSLRGLDWEDRLDYAAGVEWRPLKRVPLTGSARWLHHVRLYAARYGTRYLDDGQDWSGWPRDDVRAGAELYRECNLHAGAAGPAPRLWAEVWADASWRRTAFVTEDFRAWTLAVVPRVGVRLERVAGLMPYAMGELATTGRSEPWQNRVLLGVGARVMPFRLDTAGVGGVLRGTRIYVEHLWLVAYVEGATGNVTPVRDLRAGVAMAVNRWE